MKKPMLAALFAIAAVVTSVATAPAALAQATTTSPPTDLVNPATLDTAFAKDVAEAHLKLIQADNEARLAHRIALMKHDEEIFAWQRWASEVLLWMVVAVVLCGLAFSGYQLVVVMEMARQRLKRQQAAGAALAGDDNAGPSLESRLALSAERLEVTSSVVGVTVLVISIAFLYLFVREVYTITPLSAPLPAAETVVSE